MDAAQPRLTQLANGELIVANLTVGAVVGFKTFSFTTLAQITVTLKSTGQGALVVSTTPTGQPVATIPVAPTMQQWQALSAATVPLVGEQALYFKYRGTGAIAFKDFTLIN
ncbi:carbohydrate-binding protein [Lactiplantibacillus daowaiensis]|uniref:Carbohydrate-binding protein n=1 Tax=Lactiplantibacillus daowaiensis TaxID=2559918 RepID=A0ABW1RX86_9LACO|nr:carbohydrate-binding protein [Lactiplantibacillus daowaiensis]